MDGMENDLNFSDMGTQTDLDITDIDEVMFIMYFSSYINVLS